MADNTTLPGTGEVVRDKDRSGVKTQIVGLDLGIGTGTESLMSGTLPVDTELAAAANPADTLTNSTSAGIGQALVSMFNGTTWDRVRGDTTNGLFVNVKSIVAPVIAAGSALIGKVNVDPRTSGGLTIYKSLSVDSTGANIKSSAGQVYGWYMYNGAVATRFVKFYNKASAPTVGTDTPVMTIAIPPVSAANVFGEIGIAFATGISIGAVTAVADNSTANVTANDVVVAIFYA